MKLIYCAESAISRPFMLLARDSGAPLELEMIGLLTGDHAGTDTMSGLMLKGLAVLCELSAVEEPTQARPATPAQLRQWNRPLPLLPDVRTDAGEPTLPLVPRNRPLPGGDRAGLTPRELEVLQRIAAGDSNKWIARRLDLSLHTVKRHVANILGKLGLSSRGEAAAWYRARTPWGATGTN